MIAAEMVKLEGGVGVYTNSQDRIVLIGGVMISNLWESIGRIFKASRSVEGKEVGGNRLDPAWRLIPPHAEVDIFGCDFFSSLVATTPPILTPIPRVLCILYHHVDVLQTRLWSPGK